MIEQPTFTPEEEKIIESLNYCIDYAARTGETSFIFQTPLPNNLIEYLEDNKYKVTVVKDGMYSISFGEKLYDIESCIAWIYTDPDEIEPAISFGGIIYVDFMIAFRLYSNVDRVVEAGILYTGDEETSKNLIYDPDNEYIWYMRTEYQFNDKLYCVPLSNVIIDSEEGFVKDDKFVYWLRTFARYIDKDGNEKIQYGGLCYFENITRISIDRPEKFHISPDRCYITEYTDIDLKKMSSAFLFKGDLVTNYRNTFICAIGNSTFMVYPEIDSFSNVETSENFSHIHELVTIKDTKFRLYDLKRLFRGIQTIGESESCYVNVAYFYEPDGFRHGADFEQYIYVFGRKYTPQGVVRSHVISDTIYVGSPTSNSIDTFFDGAKNFISKEYRGYCSPLDGGVYNEDRDNLYDYVYDYYISGINNLYTSMNLKLIGDTTDFSDITQTLNNRKYWYHYDYKLSDDETNENALEFLHLYGFGDRLNISVKNIDNFNINDYTIRVNSDRPIRIDYNSSSFTCILFNDSTQYIDYFILPIDFETPYRVEFFKNDNPSEVQYVETTVLHNIATICLDESLTDEQKLHARFAMRMYINYKKYFNLNI